MSKRLLAVLPLLAAVVLAGCSDDDGNGDSASDPAGSPAPAPSCTYTPDPAGGAAVPVELPPEQPDVSGAVPVSMSTTLGEFRLTLDANQTPCTTTSFVSLARQGYFDGTTCHRMTTEGIHVLQCGDPTASGSGGPGYSFDDELTGSEVYEAGTLAMANAGPNTNGSQFFIVYGDTPLDPDYTVFGNIDDVAVKAIAKLAKKGTDNSFGLGDGAPAEPVDITSVTVG
jgi:peptidyl-prolyl cis-trans isomerase B (cyclophilin B)